MNHRSHRFRSVDGSCALVRISQMCHALPWRRPPARLLLLGSVSGMAFAQLTYRESLRDIEACLRSMHRQALPHGISRQGGALHAGRRQRVARLAHLRRLRPGLDRHCAAAVCTRSDRRRSGSESVRSGLHHHRPVPVAVSLGAIPPSTRPPSRCTRCWTCTAISPRLSAFPTAKCTMSTSSTRFCSRPAPST